MKKILKHLYLIFLLFPLTAKAFDPLPAEQAFALSVQLINNHQLQLNWQIAPGYHLYRDRFTFQLLNTNHLQLAPINLPAGIAKEDDILGKYEVYQNSVSIPLTLINNQPGQFDLQVGYQGCADSGFCYPPVTKHIILTLTSTHNSTQISNTPLKVAMTPPVAVQPAPQVSHDEASKLLTEHNWFFIFGGFLGFGLLLAFTPCVLPMLPILSSIIIGQGKKRTALRSFYLSLTYALAIAITYAIAGAIAALAGGYVQAFFQNPWVIGLFSLLFVVLSLSLFGVYELQLPASWNHYITHLSHRQQGGTYLGVFVMGCLSVLIVSPCVSAPLIGTITYLSSTGNVLLGSMALFAMGLGMGIPLIIAGTFEGKLLPKSGPWLVGVKTFFGVLLIMLAIWLLQRIIPAQISLMLWAAFCIILAVYLGALNRIPNQGWASLWRGVGIILLIYGSALLIGALQGNTNPLQPLTFTKASANKPALNFQTIKSVQALQQALAIAKTQNKPVLLDFYADWCISCKIINNNVFQNAKVHTVLTKYILLRADVTANNAQDKALEQYLNVIAPPTIIFYGTDGQEIKSARIVGEISAEQFLQQVPVNF
jgi:thiol:disulfide interchange protein DsbD